MGRVIRRAVLLTQRAGWRITHVRAAVTHLGCRGRRHHRSHLAPRLGNRLTGVGRQCRLLPQQQQRHQPDKAAACDATKAERVSHAGQSTLKRGTGSDVRQQKAPEYARHSTCTGQSAPSGTIESDSSASSLTCLLFRPIIAALAMSLSSVTVVRHELRFGRAYLD